MEGYEEFNLAGRVCSVVSFMASCMMVHGVRSTLAALRGAIVCAALFFACASLLAEDAVESTLRLNTGEVVKGTVISKTARGILIKTAYAEFEVPYHLIDNEDVKFVPAKKKLTDLSESEEMNLSNDMQPADIFAQQQNLEVEAEYPPLFDDSGSSNRVPDLIKTLETWQDDYKKFISGYIPEGWLIKLSGGYLLRQSTTSEKTVNLAFSAEKEWLVHSLNFNGYYNYTLYTDENGNSSPTTDKYGIGYNYRWKFLGTDSDWYLSSSLSYKVDAIKLINDQIDQVMGVGYAYSIESWGLKTSIDTGPTFRYLDIENEDRRYIPSWSVNESIYWDITDLLRFEHTLSLTMSLNDSSDTSVYLMVGLVFAPESIVSLALRYTGDYDSLTALKYEERFIISLEIPFDGRKK